MSLFRKFLKSRTGVIATEFALVAPLMVTIWFGIVEASSAYLVLRRVEVAAQTAADLIAQNETITAAQITDIAAAIDAILDPYPDTTDPNTAGYNFASIEADAVGTNTVVSLGTGGSRTVADPSATAADTLNTTDDSVIVVTLEYSYQPALFSTLINPFILTETAFARPRLVPVIPLIP